MADLPEVLRRSRELGFLGPGPVGAHIEHASAFAPALPDGARVLDLGSGGGVPGLVLAVQRPDLRLVLLDVRQRRVRFLDAAIHDLGVADRVDAVEGRAEDVARDPAFRHRFDAVVSRSFGAPAVTAECAVAFLRAPGGVLLVSEPPDPADDRWSSALLGELGLEDGGLVAAEADGARVRQLRVVTQCPDRYPRRSGIPAKRPLG